MSEENNIQDAQSLDAEQLHEEAVEEHKQEAKKAHGIKKDKKDEHLKKTQEELEGLKDKHIRLQAEFDNFRKRTLKEKMDLIKSAGEQIIVGILPVIDDFERALQNVNGTAENDAVVDGIKLIYNKLQDFLRQNGVREIETEGKEFDTDLHEAVTKIPAPTEDLKGKIVAVIQKGYTLNDKVIRFAKVVIGE